MSFWEETKVTFKFRIYPDIKVSGTFKEYYELLNKRLKYLHKLLLDFKIKKACYDK